MQEEEANVPNSSSSTRECLVAWCRMLAVSLSSTKKVLSPGRQTGHVRLVGPSGARRRAETPSVATCHDAIRGAQPGEDPVDGREAQPLGGDVATQLGEDDHQAALCGGGRERERERFSR